MELTVQAFKEAYEATGIKPVNNKWLMLAEGQGVIEDVTKCKVDCACALSTLYIHKYSEPEFLKVYYDDNRPQGFKRFLAEKFEIDPDYIAGFITGFDGDFQYYIHGTPKYQGYLLGKQTREEVFTHEPTKRLYIQPEA